MRGQRGTLRALVVICHRHLFLVSESLFSETSAQILQLRSEVFSEKANFNDNGGFVVGTHKHFSWGYKRSLLFVVYKRSLLTGYAKN